MRSILLKLLCPLGVLALGTSAHAVIILMEPAGGIPIPTNFAGVSVDLETGATSTDLDGLPNGDVNFFFGGAEFSNDADATAASPSWQPVRTAPGNTDPAASLTDHVDCVDGSSLFSTGFGSSGDISSHFPPFVPGAQSYIGYSMIPNAGGAPLYGWMLVTLENDGVTEGVIHSWAYEDTGAKILVGQVPEPSSGLLALVSVSLLLLRRRR